MPAFLRNILISLTTGLLLTLGWPVDGYYVLLFVAWVPLLWLERQFLSLDKNSAPLIGYAFLAMLIWNTGTTWWIKNASVGGALMAILANSLLMAIIFYGFHRVHKKLGDRAGYTSLICFWMAFEFIHLRWDITWPWLNLGNGLANAIYLVQWYEYTGTFGGTLWLLVINLLVYFLLFTDIKASRLRFLLAAWVFIPALFSIIRFYTYTEKTEPVNVVVVQPNIDPYNEKFNGMSGEEQLFRFLKLGSSMLDEETDFLVGPETALVDGIMENDLTSAYAIQMIKKFNRRYPDLHILVGASTYYEYRKDEPKSPTARYYKSTDQYFESYNTALQFNNRGEIGVYHKSKLVPGVEKMPWPAFFSIFEKYAIDLGGISGSLGMQAEREAFYTSSRKHASGAIICYESVYGEYVGEYVKKGADILAIITNDGWWGDTPGYRQHLALGALRAIETRRSIIRSANTGISGFINQKGEVLQQTGWWQEAVIKGTLNANKDLTFYTRYGDYAGRVAVLGSLLLLLMFFFRKRLNFLK